MTKRKSNRGRTPEEAAAAREARRSQLLGQWEAHKEELAGDNPSADALRDFVFATVNLANMPGAKNHGFGPGSEKVSNAQAMMASFVANASPEDLTIENYRAMIKIYQANGRFGDATTVIKKARALFPQRKGLLADEIHNAVNLGEELKPLLDEAYAGDQISQGNVARTMYDYAERALLPLKKGLQDPSTKAKSQLHMGLIMKGLFVVAGQNPQNDRITNLAGDYAVRLCMHEVAEIMFSQSIERNPDKAVYYAKLANALQNQEKREEARAVISKGLDVDPHYRTLLNMETRI